MQRDSTRRQQATLGHPARNAVEAIMQHRQDHQVARHAQLGRGKMHFLRYSRTRYNCSAKYFSYSRLNNIMTISIAHIMLHLVFYRSECFDNFHLFNAVRRILESVRALIVFLGSTRLLQDQLDARVASLVLTLQQQQRQALRHAATAGQTTTLGVRRVHAQHARRGSRHLQDLVHVHLAPMMLRQMTTS